MAAYKTSVFKREAREKKTKRVDEHGNSIYVHVRGSWIYRIRYVDRSGLSKSIERSGFRTKASAKDRMDAEINVLFGDDARDPKQIQHGERMTFKSLAEECEKLHYKPAVYDRDGTKTAGVKSHVSAKAFLKNLTEFFGKSRISELRPSALYDYKAHRSKAGVKISTINRELGVLRRVLQHAVEQGYLKSNIFATVRGVINRRDEAKRDVVINRAEEFRLLASCQGKREVEYTRIHRGREETITAHSDVDNFRLKAMILISLDSGLRRGEIFDLTWKDIDMNAQKIFVAAGKTGRSRRAPLSKRAITELIRIQSLSTERPFPRQNISRSFNTAARLAGISHITFHDLRRTWVTRRSIAGGNANVLSEVAGHSVEIAGKHYLSVDDEVIQNLSAAIDNENVEADKAMKMRKVA